MAPPKIPLPSAAEQFLRSEEGRTCRPTLTQFHRWMSTRNLVLFDLTPVHLTQFLEHQQDRNLSASTMYNHRSRLRMYLYWLFTNGQLRFAVDPPRWRHMRLPLPEVAQRFLALRGHRRHESAVRQLHAWLGRKHIALSELTPAHLDAFSRRPIATPLVEGSRKDLIRRLRPYLLWLHEQGLVRFKASAEGRKPKAAPLPESAQDFVAALQAVIKPATCHGYRADLRDFYAWLAAQDLTVEAFDRPAAERWLKSLADRGLVPGTRKTRIFNVRSYLQWLLERDAFAADPDDLLRSSDLPKIPSYLPRPYPMEADRELQQRFRQSGTVYGQALFLMRRSGVRIGELVRLEPSCLEEDLHGNFFLKVPLGKLDNERLVPLDDETRQLVAVLHKQCPVGAPFLLVPQYARQTLVVRLRATLKDAAKGLDIPGPVVSHRLRHTYATELLNTGVSMVAIMKLLGHRSLSMTMRYAAITQQTVVEEFTTAMAKILSRYELPVQSSTLDEPDIHQILRNAVSYLRNNHGDAPHAHRLINRIHKLDHDITHTLTDPSTS